MNPALSRLRPTLDDRGPLRSTPLRRYVHNPRPRPPDLETRAQLLKFPCHTTAGLRPAWFAKALILEVTYVRRKKRSIIGLGNFRSGIADLGSNKNHLTDFGH